MELRRKRILIVDDSAVMRSLLRTVISSDSGLDVAGTAADGASALTAVASLRPDLVLLDVEMPVMDGLKTLGALRASGHKGPVVMCSSLTQRGAKVTIEALAGGASDYVAKPSSQAGREAAIKTLSDDLLPKIHALTTQRNGQAATPGAYRPTILFPPTPAVEGSLQMAAPRVLVVGVSTGGPAALDVLLPALPADFPLPVLIVQHMPELFTRLFAERLNGRCHLRAREAAEGDLVRAGTIYVAKGNWHMELRGGAHASAPATLHLNQGPLENHCRPAVDVLFRSAAAVYGAGVLAVVLTGMGSDGTIGCGLIRGNGGSVMVQDEATSAVWGMPGAVVHAGLAQRVLPLGAIAREILHLVSRSNYKARELRESVG